MTSNWLSIWQLGYIYPTLNWISWEGKKLSLVIQATLIVMSLTKRCIVHPLGRLAVNLLTSNINQPTKEINEMCEYWCHNNYTKHCSYQHGKCLVHSVTYICYFRGFQNNVCHFSCIFILFFTVLYLCGGSTVDLWKKYEKHHMLAKWITK